MHKSIRARAIRVGATLAVIGAMLPPALAGAQQAPDFDVSGGHFFSQTGGGGGKGYAVSDADGVEFWKAFSALGGVEVVGYPVSNRFMHGGFVTQAMQKAVFQWRPESKSVAFVNVFDDLSVAGRDEAILATRSTPKPAAFPAEAGKQFAEVVTIRQAALDARPAMRAIYLASSNPVLQYGLPTSQVTDMGNHFAVRLQRAVIQEWKTDVPWAKAGQATVANGGDIAKEAGLFNQAALAPVEPGAATATVSTAPAPAPVSPPVPAAPSVTAPPAPSGPASAASGGLVAPTGGLVLKPGQPPPYNVPIQWSAPEPGRVNVIQAVRTQLGGDRIIGLIRNDTGAAVLTLKILITGSDANGSVRPDLITEGRTYREFMSPGEVLAFEGQGAFNNATTFNISTSARAGTASNVYRDVFARVTGQSKNRAGWLVVQGSVNNPSREVRRNVSIVVVGLDAQGNLLDVGTSSATPNDLDPGQSGTFSVTLPANSSNIISLSVSAEANDKRGGDATP